MKTFFELSENLQESLAAMAAKHAFHHQMAEVEGSRASERKANKIRDEIKAKHGASVAKAVVQHSHDANQHDNGSMGVRSKEFHKKFVKTHLGGDHAEYRKHIAKAFYGDHPPHAK